ncbi:hypothetical protein Q7526_00395 [Glaesserella parasuis]|uniref:hypothetical protein n=1 Tax=Glaesserella parasuis TaxID=738 RepID=UPI0003AC22EE|nr:hypothetical protein [Glaesserella parasuis]ATW43331.1 hypothetical protein A2U20_05745 [Glaesserella parasuis D74]EQA10797.1 hypothetical protein HPSD74_0497 [Glaesserella parasuis D74]MDO9795695.1 hypothetical protein [Glaesserella parasuis]MDO9960579.1 hypothetical protein [Glaesserella parasuis]MDP0316677.1 hypothetical protein [Glaesserella parasuis]
MGNLNNLFLEHINSIMLFLGVILCTPIFTRLIKIIAFYVNEWRHPEHIVEIAHYHNGKLQGTKQIKISMKSSLIDQLEAIKKDEVADVRK